MLKRLSLYTLLICLVPFFTWILNFHWQGATTLTNIDYFLYWLTETGSNPYGIITCGFFALLFLPLAPNRKQWILAVGVMAFSIILSQGIKFGLKTAFAEPRPFVTEITQQHDITADYFYDKPRSERAAIVTDFYTNKLNAPSWIVHHYENETGYSFPSGHTIFAVGWLLLAVGFTRLFAPNSLKAKLLVSGIAVWTILMLISRLRLGMHYPIDLLTSTLIAWLIHCGIFLFLEKKQFFSNNDMTNMNKIKN